MAEFGRSDNVLTLELEEAVGLAVARFANISRMTESADFDNV